MAKLNLRFDIDGNTNQETSLIDKGLPLEFISFTQENENFSPKRKNNIYSLSYCYSYENVFELDSAINSFINTWKEFSNVLKELVSISCDLHISFEITVTDWNFPAIVFEKEFIDFTSNHNITFGMYFWSGDDRYN